MPSPTPAATRQPDRLRPRPASRTAPASTDARRAELIDRSLPLAHHVARRFSGGSEPFDDLFQVASLALVKAVDRYDPERGVAFSSYAVPTMVGEIKRHFRDRTWAVRPGRSMQELSLRISAGVTALTGELHRAPSVAEICAYLGDVDEQQVLDALQAGFARQPDSLQRPHGTDSDAPSLDAKLGVEDAGYARAEHRAVLDRLLAGLPKRERLILRLRFEDDLTQAEIGAVIGVSQMQVSRLIRESLERLRTAAAAEQHDEAA
jgi:RNA polymerase sigma-B factor